MSMSIGQVAVVFVPQCSVGCVLNVQHLTRGSHSLLSFVLCSENYYGDDAEVKLLKKQQQKAKGKTSQKDDN